MKSLHRLSSKFKSNMTVGTVIVFFIIFIMRFTSTAFWEPDLPVLEPVMLGEDDTFMFPEQKPIDEVLVSNLPPLTVHYFWCFRDKYFHYANYLSVRSVVKVIRPHKILFHYTHLPRVDSSGYLTWFEELRSKIPHFVINRINEAEGICNNPHNKLTFILETLSGNGGIYVNENVLLIEFDHNYRNRTVAVNKIQSANYKMSYVLTDSVAILFTTGKYPLPVSNVFVNQIMKSNNLNLTCTDGSRFSTNASRHTCIIADDRLLPHDIWELETDFGKLARWIHYGDSRLLKSTANWTTPIPRISHYVWLGNRPLSFAVYLSITSAIYIGKFDKVYIHGDYEPTGKYWEHIKHSERNVQYIKVDFPEYVFGTAVKVPSHASDLLRVYILILYGGVYQDVNAFWLKPIPDDLRAHEAVASFDWPQWGMWPNSINLGVLMAKQNSKYLRAFLPTLRNYKDHDWGYNAVLMPFKVYENHPEWLYITSHLQVLCMHKICHPTWVKGFKIPQASKVKPSDNFDWRNDTLAIHFTGGEEPDEFKDLESIRTKNGYVADIGRYILQRAGKL